MLVGSPEVVWVQAVVQEGKAHVPHLEAQDIDDILADILPGVRYAAEGTDEEVADLAALVHVATFGCPGPGSDQVVELVEVVDCSAVVVGQSDMSVSDLVVREE